MKLQKYRFLCSFPAANNEYYNILYRCMRFVETEKIYQTETTIIV